MSVGRTPPLALSEHVDKRGDMRTAILLALCEDNQTSIDVIVADGTRLCRLNIYDFGDGAGIVDVIIDPETQHATQLRWEGNGNTIAVALAPGKGVSATDIRRKA